MRSRSSSAIVSPICVMSLSRDSFPERLCSIFRYAIERTSSLRVPPDGRSVDVSSNGTTSPFPRVLAVIIAASAQATSSRGFAACVGPTATPVETVSRPTASASSSPSSSPSLSASASGVGDVGGRQDDRELLASDPADDVAGAHGRTQHVGHLEQELIADPVSVDVVDLLEVVQVEHDQTDRVVLGRRSHELLPHAVVERPVVVEAGQRVRRRLVLECRADVSVVEGERGRVPEARGEEELLLAELRVLADSVDVERPLETPARDQWDGDERLGLDRRSRHEAHAWIEMRLVRQHRLPVLDRPARDSFSVAERLAHHLGRPLAAREDRDEFTLRLVGRVDVDVLVGDQNRQCVGYPLEQGVETLLGQDVVEDLG